MMMRIQRLIRQNKTTLLSGLGAGLEYYDFVIYVMLTHYISVAFFPQNTQVGLLGTLSIFSAGYFIRSLGGFVLGSLGDRYGRKNIFLFSISMMAISTLGIAFIPTYNQIGILAPCLLLLFRLLQGFSLGAEVPGAITFLVEHVGNKHRGTHCGFLFANIGLGAMLSSFVCFLMTSVLNAEQMTHWGFRLPFLFGGLLAVICFYMRRNIFETPTFQKQTSKLKSPLLDLLKNNRKQIFLGIGITFFAACFIIYALYLPTYLNRYFGYSLKITYFASTFSLAWSSLCLPIFGWISDKIGRNVIMYSASIVVVLLGYDLFYMVSHQSVVLLILFMFLYQTITAALAACYPTMLAELFPTKVRYSGVAFCYNVAFSIASFTPLAATAFIFYTRQPLLVSLLFSFIAIVTLVASVFIEDRTQQPLPEVSQAQ